MLHHLLLRVGLFCAVDRAGCAHTNGPGFLCVHTHMPWVTVACVLLCACSGVCVRARLWQQAEGERNFHVFYQLVRGASSLSDEMRSLLRLEGAPAFRYLALQGGEGGGGALQGPVAKGGDEAGYDAREFQRTLKALKW